MSEPNSKICFAVFTIPLKTSSAAAAGGLPAPYLEPALMNSGSY